MQIKSISGSWLMQNGIELLSWFTVVLCCGRKVVSLSRNSVADGVVHKNKHPLGYSIPIPQVHATFVHFVNKCCMQFFVHRIRDVYRNNSSNKCIVVGGSEVVDVAAPAAHDRDSKYYNNAYQKRN